MPASHDDTRDADRSGGVCARHRRITRPARPNESTIRSTAAAPGRAGASVQYGALLADRRHDANHDVVDQRDVEHRAITRGRPHLRGELQRGDFESRAVGAPPATWRPDVVVD
ncbi:hypothetical protein Bcep18194_C6737 [Burkholderia lata]|uniref:Uncharacterized protein n=1 Tax=Burkholderia lata (strain ATCC 17760 / DSM 23089 / LMG 22485 / NCIMB 9086 / R18194 / 383) TaxID=482957 RepID=Q39P30_BURL3|nr:hypothetical protein Bcep18194_C6737 [Burkholderia lata]